jgi:preprotein translocase subunit SecY
MSELYRRIAFTLGALLVYRLAAHIPLPGIDVTIWREVLAWPPGGGFKLSSLAARRVAILALDIAPYLSAAILMQVAMILSRRLRALRDRGEGGRLTIAQWTRYAAVALAAVQALGIAIALQDMTGIVPDAGWSFKVSTVLTLTGGTIFLIWLADQITLRGIGNGLALILSAGLVAELPAALSRTLEFGRQGALSTGLIIGLLALAVAATAFAVWVESARRNIPIVYSRRPPGQRQMDAQPVWLPVKINPAGIIPLAFASWLLTVIIVLMRFVLDDSPSWFVRVAAQLEPGRPGYLVLQTAFIVFCIFFYAAFLLDPDRIAADLERHGGRVAAVEPGEPTAVFIDQVVSRTATIGAGYLALMWLLPEILIAYMRLPFYLGGASLLIVVCTALDLLAQVRVHLSGMQRG